MSDETTIGLSRGRVAGKVAIVTGGGTRVGTEEGTGRATASPTAGALGDIDIELYNSCGGPVKVVAPAHSCARDISASMHVIACIEDPLVIKKTLTHIDSKAAAGAARRVFPCRAPPQASLFA